MREQSASREGDQEGQLVTESEYKKQVPTSYFINIIFS